MLLFTHLFWWRLSSPSKLRIEDVTKMKNSSGRVFDIQTYAIHDGPGIRTLVFLKGCPLRCLWCQNPESQSPLPEVLFYSDKCTGCGKCVEVCPEGAIEIVEGRSRIKRDICKGTGKCAEVCPNEARTLAGREVTAEEVLREVEKDKIFYKRSGGGVTLSGGEPLAQPEFATDVLRLCKEAGIHTCIETTGYAKWDTLKQVLEYTDLVLYDLKHMDPVEHVKCTGVSNKLILDNTVRLHLEFPAIPVTARIPVIPGYNDSVENIEATAQFVAHELGPSTPVNILAYHKLGESKYRNLEKTDHTVAITPPSEEHLSKLKNIIESFWLSVAIGG
jgi:pyruvate formate lyase activating enzyme